MEWWEPNDERRTTKYERLSETYHSMTPSPHSGGPVAGRKKQPQPASAPRPPAVDPAELCRRLDMMYPEADCSLEHQSPLELLVSTILSAQCTDERVNQVTKTLFQKYRSPEDY